MLTDQFADDKERDAPQPRVEEGEIQDAANGRQNHDKSGKDAQVAQITEPLAQQQFHHIAHQQRYQEPRHRANLGLGINERLDKMLRREHLFNQEIGYRLKVHTIDNQHLGKIEEIGCKQIERRALERMQQFIS